LFKDLPSWKREILHVQQYTKIIKMPTLKIIHCGFDTSNSSNTVLLFLNCKLNIGLWNMNILSYTTYNWYECACIRKRGSHWWTQILYFILKVIASGHRSRDRMVVGFTTTYAIGAYHITVLYLKSWRCQIHNGANKTDICDRQIHNWHRQLFKYSTVIPILRKFSQRVHTSLKTYK
jgi:hypothetical protein